MNVQVLAEQIKRLTVRDLAELRRLLGDDFFGGAGVREPRQVGPGGGYTSTAVVMDVNAGGEMDVTFHPASGGTQP